MKRSDNGSLFSHFGHHKFKMEVKIVHITTVIMEESGTIELC